MKKGRISSEEEGSVAPTVIPMTSPIISDEMAIKTRITNATAMGQLGIPMKRWMVNSGNASKNDPNTKPLPSAGAATTTSSFFVERRLTMKDFIAVVSMDPVLCKCATLMRALLSHHTPQS